MRRRGLWWARRGSERSPEIHVDPVGAATAMTAKPGKRNLITDVAGLRIGNAADERIRSGVTVLLPDRPVVASVDVRGGAPGTRETDLLDPSARVEEVHAIVLSGGSAFGLDAGSAVANALAARGVGLAVGAARVPIVPAAILFDLLNGGDKDWGEMPPYAALGRQALDAASPEFALGNEGAGYGAKAGRLKGGLGSASIVTAGGLAVGALVAANPRGSVVMPGEDCFWAWALERDGELGGQAPPRGPIAADADLDLLQPPGAMLGANTTIGIVATNAQLGKAELKRVAMMAQDGYARAIRPVHTPFDGDIVFALSTGALAVAEPRASTLAIIGALAADCVARAVARGVFAATSLGPFPAYRERHGRPA
jgi:L-aminopeptidase/D-esterase-like protein